jgi:DNA/RNA endonuclease YhcR with UshA esterase domain
MIINLRYDAAASAPGAASFRAGIQQAANLLASTIPDNITVNLNIVYSGTGGGAAAGPDSGLYESYESIRQDLVNNATPGDTTFNYLPAGLIQNQSLVAVWNAQLKLLGLLSANDTTTDDGTATFATDIDPNLLVGVALHELTHALGRVPYGPQPDIFDLFRFSAPGTRLFQAGNAAPAAYFSLNGGVTKLADYGEHSDSSDFLNPGPTNLGPPYSNLTPNDPFNELYDLSAVQGLTAIDLKQLDALGFHLSSPVLPPTGWANQANEKAASGHFISGNNAADIAAIGPGQGGIGAYISNGDGTFHTVFSPQFANHTDWDSWPNPQVVTGDFLHNGLTDLAVINPGQGGIADYLANGDGTFHAVFSPQGATLTDWDSWGSPKVVTGDFIGNGFTDVAVINPGQGGIADYVSNGDGTFTAIFSPQGATLTDWDSWPNPKIVTGDFLHNGRIDLAVMNPGQGGIATYLSNGDGTFHAVFSPQGATHTDWDSWPNPTIVTGDFLHNGRTDLAVMNPGQGGIATYLSNGDGTFTAVFSPQGATHTDWDSWSSPKVVTGDFLGNGRTDIAVLNPGQGGIADYLSNGDGTFHAVFSPQGATHTDWDSWSNPTVVTGDFNGDGRVDIAVTNPGQGQGGVAVYLSNGDGTFTAEFTPTTAAGSAVASLSGEAIQPNPAASAPAAATVAAIGGVGNDSFVFNSVNDSTASNPEMIENFIFGSDRLDFSAIAGITTIQSNEPLSSGSLNAHSIGWMVNGSNIDVYANASASAEVVGPGGNADMQIHVTNVTCLLTSDFLLHA